MRLYLAGGLFTSAERAFNAELGNALVALRHEVWLPQDHEPRTVGGLAIFNEDVKGIDWSEVVIANMDGPDPDSGTAWEVGYAYKRKPVLLFRTDIRNADDIVGMAPVNLMMYYSAQHYLSCPLWKPSAIARAIDGELGKL